MTAIVNLIRLSPVIFALLSGLDGALCLAGSAFIAASLFRLPPRKKPVYYAAALLLCAVGGAVQAFAFVRQDDGVSAVASTVGMLLPYCCMALIFPRRGLWKALLVTVGYTFVEAARFLILLVFFRFDNDSRDDATELFVEFLVDVAAFLLASLLLAHFVKKRTVALHVTRTAAILFVLVVASVAVFVTSLMLMGSAYSAARHGEFAFMLLNIPVLTATVSFALVSFFRMRGETETYREQLNMQIRQYEWMEQMNEELRMFRHDFPKKMRPLIAYLDENKTGEAREMAEGFSDFVAHTGAPFRTGNFRLDTVLSCEQQVAQRYGVRLDVPCGAAFPKDVVAPDDLYTIFPNALDNAIEAAAKTDGDKTVEFRSHVSGDTVYVTIRNPVQGPVRQKNGVPQTTKDDKKAHGYGFRSMKRAAAKYGGDNVEFSVENGVFELRIFLRIPPPQG